MINGMYLSCMGAMVEQAKHETTANNLANSETTGFKPDFATFMSIPAESVWKGLGRRESDLILEKTGGGVWMDQTTSDFTQGPMRETGSTFDLSIMDENDKDKVSFFMIRPQGEQNADKTFYTRNGNFTQNSEGMLVTKNGDMVLDATGQPISIPALNGGKLGVNRDGEITITRGTEEQIVGQVGLASTTLSEAQRGLKKLGDSLFEPDTAVMVGSPIGTKIASGVIEQSAVEPVKEMVAMIEGQRMYEQNMKFLSLQDESLGAAISRLNGRA